MNKLRWLIVAAFACLAAGSVAVAGAKPNHHKQVTHVPTKVKIAYSPPGGEYSPDTGFTGSVKAKKGCAKKRTVKLSHYGKTKTSTSGTYAFAVGQSGASAGDYKVKVLEKDIGDEIVCDPVKATLTVQ